MNGLDVAMIMLSVEQAAVEAALANTQPDEDSIWPTRVIGTGPIDNVKWYALTTTGVTSPLFKTSAEAHAWAVGYTSKRN